MKSRKLEILLGILFAVGIFLSGCGGSEPGSAVIAADNLSCTTEITNLGVVMSGANDQIDVHKELKIGLDPLIDQKAFSAVEAAEIKILAGTNFTYERLVAPTDLSCDDVERIVDLKDSFTVSKDQIGTVVAKLRCIITELGKVPDKSLMDGDFSNKIALAGCGN